MSCIMVQGVPEKKNMYTYSALNFRSLLNIYANFRNIIMWKAWFNSFLKLMIRVQNDQDMAMCID